MTNGVTIVADADLEALVEIVARASALAAERYAAHLERPLAVESKGDGDPVTAVDRDVDELITAALAVRFPGAAVVSEESIPDDGSALAALLSAPAVFFVDPIDGTRELIEGTGDFAVMIGLVEGGRATVGVIGLPVEGAVLAARVGQPAFEQDRHGARSLLGVSPASSFGEARLLVSRTHAPAIVEPLRRRLGIGQVLRRGSVGHKIAVLARGGAELYAHDGPGLKLWDVCAPEAVLVAAGGRLSDLEGGALDYRQRGLALAHGVVASNGVLHPAVMSAVGWARREAARVGVKV